MTTNMYKIIKNDDLISGFANNPLEKNSIKFEINMETYHKNKIEFLFIELSSSTHDLLRKIFINSNSIKYDYYQHGTSDSISGIIVPSNIFNEKSKKPVSVALVFATSTLLNSPINMYFLNNKSAHLSSKSNNIIPGTHLQEIYESIRNQYDDKQTQDSDLSIEKKVSRTLPLKQKKSKIPIQDDNYSDIYTEAYSHSDMYHKPKLHSEFKSSCTNTSSCSREDSLCISVSHSCPKKISSHKKCCSTSSSSSSECNNICEMSEYPKYKFATLSKPNNDLKKMEKLNEKCMERIHANNHHCNNHDCLNGKNKKCKCEQCVKKYNHGNIKHRFKHNKK
jgi:hypothetical protein